MANILTIKKGEGFRIKVEEPEKIGQSFFSEVYRDGYLILRDIVIASEEANKREKQNRREGFGYAESWRCNDNHTLEDEYNNIIAFLGERGTGKSSALKTFVNGLGCLDTIISSMDYKNANKCSDDKLLAKELKEIRYKKFHVLDTIDPSTFEKNDSVLEIVIASMFMRFKTMLNRTNSDYNMENKRKLLESFQDVYESLRILKTGNEQLYKEFSGAGMTIEMISKMASGTDIKNQIKNLVANYLQFMEKSKCDSFLVIPIDDIDMNIQYSAPMTEEIRKYMMMPNVIVVMAAKLEQLKDTIEKLFRSNFKDLTNNGGTLSEDAEEMTNRYVEKLIPNGRKLFLPEIKVFDEDKRIHLKITKEIDKVTEKLDEDKGVVFYEKELDLQESILKLIYQKTGLIFIKPKYGIHHLIPDTMRELQGFLQMLIKMKDVYGDNSDEFKFITEKGFDEIELNKKNIDVFRAYFVNSWVKRNLNKDYEHSIYEFLNVSNEYKNKFIVDELRNIIDAKIERKEIREDKLKENEAWNKTLEITDIFNRGENISLGDVIFLMDKVEKYVHDNDYKFKKYIFALKTLYSMEIYHSMFLKKDEKERIYAMRNIIKGDIFSAFLNENIGFSKENKEKKEYEDSVKRIYLDIKDYKKIKIEGESIEDIIERLKELLKNNEYGEKLDEELTKMKIIERLKLSLEYGHDYEPQGSKLRQNSYPFYERSFYLEDEIIYKKDEEKWVKSNSYGMYDNATFNSSGMISKIFYMDMRWRCLLEGLSLKSTDEKSLAEEKDKIQGEIIKSRIINSYEDRIVLPIYSLECVQEYMNRGVYLSSKRLNKEGWSAGYDKNYYKPFIGILMSSLIDMEQKYIKDPFEKMKDNLNSLLFWGQYDNTESKNQKIFYSMLIYISELYKLITVLNKLIELKDENKNEIKKMIADWSKEFDVFCKNDKKNLIEQDDRTLIEDHIESIKKQLTGSWVGSKKQERIGSIRNYAIFIEKVILNSEPKIIRIMDYLFFLDDESQNKIKQWVLEFDQEFKRIVTCGLEKEYGLDEKDIKIIEEHIENMKDEVVKTWEEPDENRSFMIHEILQIGDLLKID